jgi:hypothetical protein
VCAPAGDQQTYPPARVTSGTTARVPLAWRYRAARGMSRSAGTNAVLLEVDDQRVGRRDVHAVRFGEPGQAMERTLTHQSARPISMPGTSETTSSAVALEMQISL